MKIPWTTDNRRIDNRPESTVNRGWHLLSVVSQSVICAFRDQLFSLRLGAAGLAVLLLPLTALACPNCYASSDTHVLHTYYFSAFMLTLLPFVIIGGILLVAKSLQRQAPVCHGEREAPVNTEPRPV